jgi:hypothetical protein
MARRPKRRGKWTTPPGSRRKGEDGIVLITALLAVLLVTVVVVALVSATMGETSLSFDQSRSTQALPLAEGGALRALAELRQRLTTHLTARLADDANAGATLQAHCAAQEGWRVITDYAYPPALAAGDWVDDSTNRRAVLAVGTPSVPLAVRDLTGAAVGSFYATTYVRPSDNQPGPANQAHLCRPGGAARYEFWFDYFIVATGVTRNARRTVCLKNPGNLVHCGRWLASRTPGAASFDSAPATHGFEVLAEEAPPYAAPRFPRLDPDVLYDRPVWEELTAP